MKSRKNTHQGVSRLFSFMHIKIKSENYSLWARDGCAPPSTFIGPKITIDCKEIFGEEKSIKNTFFFTILKHFKNQGCFRNISVQISTISLYHGSYDSQLVDVNRGYKRKPQIYFPTFVSLQWPFATECLCLMTAHVGENFKINLQ